MLFEDAVRKILKAGPMPKGKPVAKPRKKAARIPPR
jgi:hypothetical protein